MTKLDTADLMRQKFILELNGALAMENAGIDRLQTRIFRNNCIRSQTTNAASS